MTSRLLVVQVAGLSPADAAAMPAIASLCGAELTPPLPGLTGPSQASLLTGEPPAVHGIVANGWYDPTHGRVFNWPRSWGHVGGTPLWDAARTARPGLRAANLFGRYATHSRCDVVVVERPAYWSDGRKTADHFAAPADVGERLRRALGPFPLFRFWGPAAGIASTRWIVDATLDVMRHDDCQLVLTYLPHLDYDLQRHGPDHPLAAAARADLDRELARLIAAGWPTAVVGDYGYEAVRDPVPLNRALRRAGLLSVTREANGEILECGDCRAFAVCDQQVAHVYCRDDASVAAAAEALRDLDGVADVLDREAMRAAGLDHPRAGQLLVVADAGRWLSYPYWLDDADAPDFARCVAIHDKPGFDPAELLLASTPRLALRLLQKLLRIRAPFDVVPLDPSRVGGAHGRPGLPAALRTTWDIDLPDRLPMTGVRAHLLAHLTDRPADGAAS